MEHPQKIVIPIIFGLIAVLLAILTLISVISSNSQPTQTYLPPTQTTFISPTLVMTKEKQAVIKNKPLSVAAIPTLSPDKGQGIDTYSLIVTLSTAEIEKLKPLLPYEKTFVSSNGAEISILIPGGDLLENPWTLTIHTFGIDFQGKENTAQERYMQQAFLESIDSVFTWMKTNNVEPTKIVVQWGDKEYMHTRAEKWLKE